MKKKKEPTEKQAQNSKKTTKAKKKEKKMMQTHAKEENFQPTTLDQVWGDTGNTRFGTMDEKEYIKSLDEMDKADLQAHANYAGLVPVDNREVLTKKLVTEFRKYVSGFKKPSNTVNPPPTISEEAAKVLSEGK